MPLTGERKLIYNREWQKIPRDGRCAAMVGVHRCDYNGFYDGETARVLCGIHQRVVERGGSITFALEGAYA